LLLSVLTQSPGQYLLCASPESLPGEDSGVELGPEVSHLHPLSRQGHRLGARRCASHATLALTAQLDPGQPGRLRDHLPAGATTHPLPPATCHLPRAPRRCRSGGAQKGAGSLRQPFMRRTAGRGRVGTTCSRGKWKETPCRVSVSKLTPEWPVRGPRLSLTTCLHVELNMLKAKRTSRQEPGLILWV
jgi:hypothetical protein